MKTSRGRERRKETGSLFVARTELRTFVAAKHVLLVASDRVWPKDNTGSLSWCSAETCDDEHGYLCSGKSGVRCVVNKRLSDEPTM